jgi:predicted O-linked N-acetylglucosamine transferase (SPINDLY family)
MLDDHKRQKSNVQYSRQDFGLPDNSFIFCCFNSSYKINPEILLDWCEILRATSNSVLWLAQHNETFKANFLAKTYEHGINPNRIVFAQRLDNIEDHLSRVGLADLFLDTHPYNAHTTGLDSLKTGVPVLSMLGKSFASRVGASLLTAANLPELIVNSRSEYIDFAKVLARNPEMINSVRRKLLQNLPNCPLFDLDLYAVNLESAYKVMHDRSIQSLNPVTINI